MKHDDGICLISGLDASHCSHWTRFAGGGEAFGVGAGSGIGWLLGVVEWQTMGKVRLLHSRIDLVDPAVAGTDTWGIDKYGRKLEMLCQDMIIDIIKSSCVLLRICYLLKMKKFSLLSAVEWSLCRRLEDVKIRVITIRDVGIHQSGTTIKYIIFIILVLLLRNFCECTYEMSPFTVWAFPLAKAPTSQIMRSEQEPE